MREVKVMRFGLVDGDTVTVRFFVDEMRFIATSQQGSYYNEHVILTNLVTAIAAIFENDVGEWPTMKFETIRDHDDKQAAEGGKAHLRHRIKREDGEGEQS